MGIIRNAGIEKGKTSLIFMLAGALLILILLRGVGLFAIGTASIPPPPSFVTIVNASTCPSNTGFLLASSSADFTNSAFIYSIFAQWGRNSACQYIAPQPNYASPTPPYTFYYPFSASNATQRNYALTQDKSTFAAITAATPATAWNPNGCGGVGCGQSFNSTSCNPNPPWTPLGQDLVPLCTSMASLAQSFVNNLAVAPVYQAPTTTSASTTTSTTTSVPAAGAASTTISFNIFPTSQSTTSTIAQTTLKAVSVPVVTGIQWLDTILFTWFGI